MTRTEDLTRTGYCKVHQGEFEPGGHYDRVRMVEVGVCGDCDHWLDLWRARHQENVIRVNCRHYMYGKHLDDYQVDPGDTLEAIAERFSSPGSKRGKGMGGDKHVIMFNDGRVVITDDLWHQGDIPQMFKHLLPNNAVFLRV